MLLGIPGSFVDRDQCRPRPRPEGVIGWNARPFPDPAGSPDHASSPRLPSWHWGQRRHALQSCNDRIDGKVRRHSPVDAEEGRGEEGRKYTNVSRNRLLVSHNYHMIGVYPRTSVADGYPFRVCMKGFPPCSPPGPRPPAIAPIRALASIWAGGYTVRAPLTRGAHWRLSQVPPSYLYS
jgi:hypothetical protein